MTHPDDRPDGPRWALPAAFALALLVTSCAGAVDDGGSGAGVDAETASADLARGEGLYANNCAQCHGADLRGTAEGPPHIDPVYEPSHHGDEAFRLAVARGAPQHHWDFGAMPPVAGLSEQDVTDIIAYVRAQQRAAGIE